LNLKPETLNLSERDLKTIWHPFTPQENFQSVAITRGEGSLLFDEHGKVYIDAISSWWVNLHGHAHPYIAKKIAEQLNTLEHAIFSGFTHRPAVELSERLLALLPGMSRVFYSDDGSTAVEVGLKMALQHWSNRGEARTKIIAFENAYHGDTFGSMSVGARNVFSQAFEKLLFDVVTIPVPVPGKENDSVSALKNILNDSPPVAAFIFEPLVQGAGGMVMYSPEILDELIRICRSKKVITIADEVMTGFGRTGEMFATDHCAQKPDIICLSKGITGGFMPLGATLCTAEVYAAFRTGDKTKTFFHGHSYTGNPLACVAAIASLEVFENENVAASIEKLSAYMAMQVKRFESHPAVKEARSRGTILALELNSGEATSYLNPVADKVILFFMERGIILRPLGNVIYVLPPYCIKDEELSQVMIVIEEFINKV
jgi:adenosylmethionine---8-amino-7-oxononanoate aminotransferase